MLFNTFLLALPLLANAGNQHWNSNRSPHAIRRRHTTRQVPNGGRTFTRIDRYAGQNFFDGFDFFNHPDPTHGNVEYVNRDEAFGSGLAFVTPDNVAYMRVDNSSFVPENGNRKSVRIETKKSYDGGLFILDVLSMPSGCSVWPAFWTTGPDWPSSGEIDILEGVHDAPYNHYTLHTNPGCTIDQSRFTDKVDAGRRGQPVNFFTGKVAADDCNSFINSNTGCGIADTDKRSYGKELNKVGGGVFATLWDEQGIKVWFFPREAVPEDISKASPNPSSWGAPKAFWSSSTCSTAKFFKNHKIIINTTLCGDWAGSTYGAAGCPGTCGQRVMDPSNFDDARWRIASVEVYQ